MFVNVASIGVEPVTLNTWEANVLTTALRKGIKKIKKKESYGIETPTRIIDGHRSSKIWSISQSINFNHARLRMYQQENLEDFRSWKQVSFTIKGNLLLVWSVCLSICILKIIFRHPEIVTDNLRITNWVSVIFSWSL